MLPTTLRPGLQLLIRILEPLPLVVGKPTYPQQRLSAEALEYCLTAGTPHSQERFTLETYEQEFPDSQTLLLLRL